MQKRVIRLAPSVQSWHLEELWVGDSLQGRRPKEGYAQRHWRDGSMAHRDGLANTFALYQICSYYNNLPFL